MMTLGAYTFESNPADMPVIGSYYRSAWVPTHGGAARIGWGEFIAGQTVTLRWDFMTPDQYSQLRTLWITGAEMVFDPDADGATYNVHIENLRGAFWQSQDDGVEVYRQNVELDLLIMSLSTAGQQQLVIENIAQTQAVDTVGAFTQGHMLAVEDIAQAASIDDLDIVV